MLKKMCLKVDIFFKNLERGFKNPRLDSKYSQQDLSNDVKHFKIYILKVCF